jgi:RNA polymerase sigma-70 factor (family 1)
MDDQTIIRAIASKDNQAFRQLVEQYQNMVANLAYKFTRNKQDAEDIAQEVFFTVWKEAGKFRGEASISTWLYRITSNKALNYLRKHKRDKQTTSEDELAHKPDSSAKTPEGVMEQSENQKILYLALDELPEKYRIPFILNKLEGMPYRRIADTLKISIANVETRIYRAKKALQKILIKQMES